MKTFRKIISRLLIILVILALVGGGLVFYAFYIEPHRFSTETYNVKSPKINEKITVAVFADTHFGHDYDLRDFSKVIESMDSSSPDVIIFLGDLVDDYNNYSGNMSKIVTALATLDAPLGKYAVFGNHDYGGGAENHYEDWMNAAGFTVLKNRTVSLGSNLTLTGIDDYLIGYGNAQAASGLSSDKYNIVMCHEPDVADKISGDSVDMMVAGHTHGGQINIPFYTKNFLPSLGRKYIKGEYTLDNDAKTKLYVNNGLGTTKISARFMAVPKVTYFILSPE